MYPAKLNTLAIPLWIVIANSTLKLDPAEPYPTTVFLFK
jgi:hypothetical protein